MTPGRARLVARQVLAQDAGHVHNVRPIRGDVYDQQLEQRTVSLDVLEWSLVCEALRAAPTQAQHDLEQRLRDRLAHPSARRK